jgi:hypothetical protein
MEETVYRRQAKLGFSIGLLGSIALEIMKWMASG